VSEDAGMFADTPFRIVFVIGVFVMGLSVSPGFDILLFGNAPKAAKRDGETSMATVRSRMRTSTGSTGRKDMSLPADTMGMATSPIDGCPLLSASSDFPSMKPWPSVSFTAVISSDCIAGATLHEQAKLHNTRESYRLAVDHEHRRRGNIILRAK
jgi:hypothetical protein